MNSDIILQIIYPTHSANHNNKSKQSNTKCTHQWPVRSTIPNSTVNSLLTTCSSTKVYPKTTSRQASHTSRTKSCTKLPKPIQGHVPISCYSLLPSSTIWTSSRSYFLHIFWTKSGSPGMRTIMIIYLHWRESSYRRMSRRCWVRCAMRVRPKLAEGSMRSFLEKSNPFITRATWRMWRRAWCSRWRSWKRFISSWW